MTAILQLTAAALGMASAALLFYGSQGVPWNIQSWKGKTEKEIKFKKSRQICARLGFLFLAGAFGLQALAVLLGNAC